VSSVISCIGPSTAGFQRTITMATLLALLETLEALVLPSTIRAGILDRFPRFTLLIELCLLLKDTRKLSSESFVSINDYKP
jgi:hypothetical protein